MKVKVNFINIGRSKFSDTKEYEGIKQEIIKEIETEVSHHLISSNISIGKPIFNQRKTSIYAGFRKVGEIEVIK